MNLSEIKKSTKAKRQKQPTKNERTNIQRKAYKYPKIRKIYLSLPRFHHQQVPNNSMKTMDDAEFVSFCALLP